MNPFVRYLRTPLLVANKPSAPKEHPYIECETKVPKDSPFAVERESRLAAFAALASAGKPLFTTPRRLYG